VIAKPGSGGTRLSQHFHQMGALNQIFHYTKSISVIKFSLLFLLPLEVSEKNLRWMGGITPTNNLVAPPNNLEILLVNAFVPPPTFAWHKVNLLSSSSVLLFFYHLKSVIVKPASPSTFSPGGSTNAFVSPTFSWHKVNFCHQV